MRSVKIRSVENEKCGKWECRKCGVRKMRSAKMCSVQHEEGGVWGVGNVQCGK